MPVTPEGSLHKARFVERPNRFIVVADVDGDRVRAHCPNPGRLGEFLHEDTPYRLRKRPDATPDQATRYSVLAAVDGRFHVDSDLALGQAPPVDEPSFDEGAWVVLDTQLANPIVADALEAGRLDDVFEGYAGHTREPAAGEGRLDLAVDADAGRTLVEVKSVTLIGNDGETALFPDAPTERGRRHVRELAERAREGQPVALVLLAMREDAASIAPNTFTDPAFAEALADAREAGVELVGARIRIGDSLALAERIPVVLDPGEAATGVTSTGNPAGRDPAGRE